MKKFHLEPTDAERLFKNADLLTSRPENMTYEEYRALRKLQTRALHIVIDKPSNPNIARLMRPKQMSNHQTKLLIKQFNKDNNVESKSN